MVLATLERPPPTVAYIPSVGSASPSPALLNAPPPMVPKSSLTTLALVVAPPPPIVAPWAPFVTAFPLNPPITLGLVALGSSRKARAEFTLKFRGTLLVVPRKLVPAAALPPSFQYR